MIHEILKSIDLIQESTLDTEIDVCQSIANAYAKSAWLLETYDGDDIDDFQCFQEMMVLEANDDTKEKEEPKENEFRKKKNGKMESMIISILKFLPRLLGVIVKKIKGLFKKEPSKIDKDLDFIREYGKNHKKQVAMGAALWMLAGAGVLSAGQNIKKKVSNINYRKKLKDINDSYTEKFSEAYNKLTPEAKKTLKQNVILKEENGEFVPYIVSVIKDADKLIEWLKTDEKIFKECLDEIIDMTQKKPSNMSPTMQKYMISDIFTNSKSSTAGTTVIIQDGVVKDNGLFTTYEWNKYNDIIKKIDDAMIDYSNQKEAAIKKLEEVQKKIEKGECEFAGSTDEEKENNKKRVLEKCEKLSKGFTTSKEAKSTITKSDQYVDVTNRERTNNLRVIDIINIVSISKQNYLNTLYVLRKLSSDVEKDFPTTGRTEKEKSKQVKESAPVKAVKDKVKETKLGEKLAERKEKHKQKYTGNIDFYGNLKKNMEQNEPKVEKVKESDEDE